MNLFVVRHGKTIWNLEKKIQGQTDIELCEQGIKEAMELKEIIATKNIDIVITSPLSRALDTAKLITNNMSPILIDNRLLERSYGILEGVNREGYSSTDYWNYNTNLVENGIEPVLKLFERTNEFLKDLKEEYNGKNVLIVTHNGICRTIYYSINGIPEDGDLSKKKTSNLQIDEYII
ncbi:MAG: histidine phosphatase family protein [Bacilli bacterium]